MIPKVIAVIVFGFNLTLPTLVSGQATLTSDSNPTLQNAFPVGLSYLVWHHNHDGFVDQVAVSIAKSRSSTSLDMPAGSVLELYEPLSISVPRARLPKCVAGGRLHAHSEDIRSAMAKLEDAVNSPEAQAVIANAIDQAQVQMEQHNEEIDVWRDDPLRRQQSEMQNLKNANYNPSIAASMDNNDYMADAYVSAVADLLSFAGLYGAKAAAHDRVSQQEADALGKMVSNEKEEMTKLDVTYAIANSEVKAFQQYVSSTALTLGSLYTTDGARAQVHPGGVSRTCGTISGTQDYIQFQADAPQTVAIVMARVRYDRGGVFPTYFRRVQSTNVWIAPIFWPLEAGTASVQIQDQSNHQWIGLSGSVNPGRPPVSEQLKDAKSTVGKLKKLYHNASFSGEGGDGSRTVFIP
jgi:hypothetical protein